MSRRLELLELLLSPLKATPTQFTVTVTQSPAGEGSAESFLPFIDGEQDWRSTVIRALELTSFNPEYFTPEEQDWMVKAQLLADNAQVFHPSLYQTIGKELYNALIPPSSKVEQILYASIQKAKAHGVQLLVQLKFEEDAVQVARLPDYPWELIHDGTGFLLHNQVSFSRYIAFSAVPPSLPAVEQVKVLLISSGASDKALGFQPLPKNERLAIAEGLKAARRVRLEELPAPTLEALDDYLQHSGRNAPHLLHFDGHGLFGKWCSPCRKMHKGIKAQQCQSCGAPLPDAQGYLLFENKDGGPDYVSATQLGAQLQKTRQSDGKHQIGGVAAIVLSACQSGMAVEGESVFQGAAQNLIYHAVPAIVAMQYSVTAEGARAFVRKFYQSLGERNSLAVAVSQGRVMMRVDENQWYRPVLYLRWQDNEGGQLFSSSQQHVDSSRSSGDLQNIQVGHLQSPLVIGQTVTVYQEHTVTKIKKPILMVSTPQKNQKQRIEEFKIIKSALLRTHLGHEFDLQNRLEIEASDFSQALSEAKPYIVDISGCEDGIAGLLLEDGSDEAASDNLVKLIAQLFKLHASTINCVILNGCYSKEQAQEIVQSIEFVIGINQCLGDNKILAFINEFYFHLGAGRTIKDSYELGCYRLQQKNVRDEKMPILLNKQNEKRRRRLREKLAFCEQEISNKPNNSNLLIKRAKILEDLELPKEAIDSYQQASSIDPENYKIKAEKGNTLEQFGMSEEAVNAYDEALRLEQGDYKVWWGKGKALAQGKKYAEAVESYKKAIALNPSSPDGYIIWREYGSILDTSNQHQKSVSSYKESLKLEPRYRASSYERKQVYRKMYSRSKKF